MPASLSLRRRRSATTSRLEGRLTKMNAFNVRRVRLSEGLEEVTDGVGEDWHRYRVVGATRDGLAPAKERVGKTPQRYKLVEPGTIFYNPMRILLGSIALIDEGQEPGITSPDYVVFKTRPDIIHPRWFYYWLRSEQGAAFIRSLARGAVRERLLFRRLAATELDLPPLDSQIKFARVIQPLEQARVAAQVQLVAAQTLFAARLRQVFKSRVTSAWRLMKLRDVCEVQLGKMLSPASRQGMRPRPYLRNANVQWNRFDLSSLLEMDFSEEEARKFELEKGDVLVCEGGEPGRAAVWDGQITPCYYQKALHRLRVKENLAVPEFIVYRLWYASLTQELIESRAKTTIAHLPAIRIQQLSVAMPTMSEQRFIVNQLREQLGRMKGLQEALERNLEFIGATRAALLRRASEALCRA